MKMRDFTIVSDKDGDGSIRIVSDHINDYIFAKNDSKPEVIYVTEVLPKPVPNDSFKMTTVKCLCLDLETKPSEPITPIIKQVEYDKEVIPLEPYVKDHLAAMKWADLIQERDFYRAVLESIHELDSYLDAEIIDKTARTALAKYPVKRGSSDSL